MIVPAKFEHAFELTTLAISAKRHWGYPEAWIQSWIPSLTITPAYIEAHETWIMMMEERPAGFYSLDKNEEGLWLDNLWVSPEYMGQGIGKSLFQHALERCRARKVSLLKIEADPNAQNFYEKMGARKVGEHRTEMDGEPRILPVMEIKI